MRFLLSLLLALFLAGCSPDTDTETTEPPAVAAEGPAESVPVDTALEAQEAGVAAFRSGEIGAEAFLSGMAAFASHSDPDVVIGSTRLLDFIYEEFPDLRRGLAQHVTRTYGRTYREARRTDTADAKQLSAQLGSLMAREGNDQEARNYLIRQGSLYLELDPTKEDLKPTVPTHVLESAFTQTLRARPELAFEPLLALAETGEDVERDAAMQGLTATTREEQLEALLDWIAKEDNSLGEASRADLLVSLMNASETRPTVWAWVEDNQARLPDTLKSSVPLMAAKFCSSERAASVVPLLEAEYPDVAADVQAEVEQCAALKDLQGDSITATLTP